MTFCAPMVLPDSVSVSICFCCCSVNDTPTRVSDEMPFTGSLSALPSWMAEDFASVPIAADRSTISFEVWSKIALPLPASFLMFLNVRRRFCPDWIASSSMPVFSEIADARAPTWPAEMFAALPIDWMTFSVRAVITCASRASPSASPTTLPAAMTPAIAATAPTLKAVPNLEPSVLPEPSTSLPTWVLRLDPKPLAEGRIDTNADAISLTGHTASRQVWA